MTKIIGAGGGGGGTGKGGGGGGNRTPNTAADSLDSKAYAQVVDLLSEGEIQGLKNGAKSIFFNNTPLKNDDDTDNFSDVYYDIRTGQGPAAQTHLPGFRPIQNEVGVGVTVPKATPVTRTVTDPSIDSVRVTITVPSLQSISNEGDVNGTSIDLKISTQVSGGAFVDRVTDTITGRTGDPYQRDYIIDLTGPFPINIRVTRITNDSTDPKLTNAFTWTSYTEITYAKLRYPYSAVVGLRVDAEQFNNIPSRSYLIRGIKVRIPSNATVDSTTGALIYSGVWNGTFAAAQWTSDPAWCLYDLLCSTRYGFGDYLLTPSEKVSFTGEASMLDKWAFYQASQYCSALNTRPSGSTNDYNATTGKHGIPDGLGNYEPRFSCNINIQTQEEAYNLINQMCSVFRAMSYWSAGSLTISQDAPGTRAYLFNTSNVTEEGFSYSGSSQKTRATVAIVKYFDLALRDYAFEAVEDADGIAKYGVQTKEVDAFACTSRGQAHRLGEWLLYTEKYETETVSFTASIEAGVVVRPGQIIAIADPVRSGVRRGGRIKSGTTTAITVDDATSLTLGTNPNLYLMMPDGTIENKTVTSIVGNVLTISGAFTTPPNPNTAWLFQNDAILPTRWRVLSVQEQDATNYAITALAWSSGKYDYVERGVPLQSRTVSQLNQLPDAPSSLSFTESLYTYQNEVRSQLTATWLPVPGVSEYEVQWRKDQGNWYVETVRGPLHEIFNTTPGLYEYRIYSLNAAKLPSSSFLSGSVTALGKTAPPADVTGLATVLDPDIGVTLTWNKNTDLDLQGYEIWQGASWGTGTKIGIFQTTAAKIGLLPTGTITWWIKALDTSGTYSTNATSVSITINAAGATGSVTSVYRGADFELSWQAITGNLSTDYYEIRYGSTASTWETATLAGTVKSTIFTTKATWSGTRRWYVAAVDLKGNVGVAATLDAQVTVPSAPTITEQVVDNNVLLQWNDVTQTLPIEYYELRRGSGDWATAVPIGTKQGRFTSVFETTGGTFTYWLAGYDSAGNQGTPASKTVQVSQPPDYVLQLNYNSTFQSTAQATVTRTNVALEGGRVIANVDTAETWQAHFTTRGWTTLQDQITAGYPYYAMPSLTTGSYEEVYDYGSTIASSRISITPTTELIAGAMTVTSAIRFRGATGVAGTYARTSPSATITVTSTAHGLVAGDYVYLDFTTGTATDGTFVVATAAANTFTITSGATTTTSGNVTWWKWTSADNVDQTFGSNFRYVMARYDYSSAGGDDLYAMSNLNFRLDAKQKNDQGSGRARALQSGTYSQTTTTITVTATAHGMVQGDYIDLDFTTGTATDGIYQITSAATNTFTVTSATSATTSGNVTLHAGGTPVYFTTTFVDIQAITVTPSSKTQTGTYSQSTTTITVTATAHGLLVGDFVTLDFTSGTATDGNYTVVTVPTANTFTVTSAVSATTSGNVTLNTPPTIVIYNFADVANPTNFKVLAYNTSGTRIGGNFSWSARGV